MSISATVFRSLNKIPNGTVDPWCLNCWKRFLWKFFESASMGTNELCVKGNGICSKVFRYSWKSLADLSDVECIGSFDAVVVFIWSEQLVIAKKKLSIRIMAISFQSNILMLGSNVLRHGEVAISNEISKWNRVFSPNRNASFKPKSHHFCLPCVSYSLFKIIQFQMSILMSYFQIPFLT